MGPAIAPRSSWDQSDIVDGVYFAALDKKLPAILVTPACDIEQHKVSFWTFAALFPDDQVVVQLFSKETADWPRDAQGQFNKKKLERLRERIQQLIDHRLQRYHWLPVAIGGTPAHVADFSLVTSLHEEEVQATVTRIASLASSWREQVPARYSAYMSRVGTDDYEDGEINPHIERLVKVFSPSGPE